jgi:UDP-N-acetylmuramoyl-L-alanyl-D-glutamate--2,6-diaminopimelate ligase
VSDLADVSIVAGDETYGEDPDKVVDEVWNGIDQDKTEGYKFYDRREGIKHALKIAQKGDTIAFCGMGPFSTFNTLKGPIPWDERRIVRGLLKGGPSA